MKSIFIKTISGTDKPHLVQSMAETTRSLGGEWIKSKVIRLDSQFSAMMMVSVDKDKESELKDTLEKAHPDLHFSYAPVSEYEKANTTSVTMILDCKDRPGLTHDIAKALSDLNLEVENLEFHRLPVTLVGGTVYSTKMTIQLPHTMDQELLVENMESIAENMRINFE